MAEECEVTYGDMLYRARIQRYMTLNEWSEEVMNAVFYGKDGESVEETNVRIGEVERMVAWWGDERARAYFGRKYLGIDMIDLNKYNKLKTRCEEAKRDRERAKGRLEAELEKLKEYGVDDVDEAQEKLAEMKKELAGLEDEFNSMLEEYEKKWEANLKQSRDGSD